MQPVNLKDYRPQIFSMDVDIPKERGAEGRNQQAINDLPFILKLITHSIILPESSPKGVQESQDGQYRLDWSLFQQHRFWKGSVPMADAAYGSIRHGIWIPLCSPVILEGNKTLHVAVQNAMERTDDFTVQVQFHGVEDIRQR